MFDKSKARRFLFFAMGFTLAMCILYVLQKYFGFFT